MRALFTTSPLHGHFYPMVPLAAAWRSMGHEVLVAAPDNFVTTVAHAGLPATANGPGIGLHELSAPGLADTRYASSGSFARMVSNSLAGTLRVVRSWRPDVVVAERAELAGPIAAAVHGVPHVELHWGVPELGEYRAEVEDDLRDGLRRLGLAELPKPAAVVNLWPPSLRLPHAAGHLSLRHVPYNGIARVADWMLEPAVGTRICLTLGTVVPHLAAPGLVLDVVESLAGLGHELVLAVDDDLAARLPALPPQVRHAGRVPLFETLGGCRLLVHHGGNGSSLTALAAGCPQVVLPKVDDQFENAAAIGRSGAGLVLLPDEATPERVAEYCGRVLDDLTFGAGAAAVAEEIAGLPTPMETAAVLESLAEHG
ncbi:glycosyltransferase [Actinosynnema sp. CS-041913]|uniref:glycosyltransferase n=1 Tax=Actinosynnema sp. CS-041913 TaxID=3239917 RepID=UPI003D93181C